MGLFDGTELERPVLCEMCGSDIKLCNCEPAEGPEPEVAPAKQSLKVRVDRRKRGKLMTVVAGQRGSASQRQQLLTDLKNHCGAGGTIADGDIEIQGDHNDRVRAFLQSQGFRVR